MESDTLEVRFLLGIFNIWVIGREAYCNGLLNRRVTKVAPEVQILYHPPTTMSETFLIATLQGWKAYRVYMKDDEGLDHHDFVHNELTDYIVNRKGVLTNEYDPIRVNTICKEIKLTDINNVVRDKLFSYIQKSFINA